jgi:hypothetical protein
MERHDVDFSKEDVLESTANGTLWFVDRIGCNGKWGVHRVRRSKGRIFAEGNLIWKKPWASFPDPVAPGKLIYSTPRNTHVLITWEELAKCALKK